MTESADNEQEIREWMKSKLEYLPSETWPESWIVQKCSESLNVLSTFLGVPEAELEDILEQGLEAGKHNEFNAIGSCIGLDELDVLTKLCMIIKMCHSSEFDPIVASINARLNG